MPNIIIESLGDDSFKLQYSNDKSIDSFFKSHLLKDAIVHLIETADLGGWVKDEETELQPDDFWAALLVAIAESYRNELPFDSDLSNKQLLYQLLDEIEISDEPNDSDS